MTQKTALEILEERAEENPKLKEAYEKEKMSQMEIGEE